VQAVLQRDAAIKIDSINSQLKELNSISERIYESESRKVNSNDLKDQRDAMIAKLSKLANVSVSTNDKGIVLINIGGVYGADQSGANEFELKIINGQMRMVSKNDSNAIAFLNGGELSAIADLYSNKIPSYKTNLENVANAFINKVNELHQSGNTLVQGGVSSTNIPFFGELDADGKVVNAFIDGEIKINSSILNNPKNIAASDAAGNDGNGTIANKIARLLDTKIPELNNQTLLEGYIDSLNVLGSDKVFSDNKIESSGSVLEQLKNQKTSYSGVSMDEEMTNVLKYQRSYDAAAKMIKIADEMIQTILQLV
jgi:flagellar hook-associated protein 1 FlgK